MYLLSLFDFSVPLLREVPDGTMAKIADVLEEVCTLFVILGQWFVNCLSMVCR